jgi:hypothetical protein
MEKLMKRENTPLTSSPAPRRDLEPHASAEHHGTADVRRMERFLAAVRNGCEMGHLARWRVRPTAGDDDEVAGQ